MISSRASSSRRALAAAALAALTACAHARRTVPPLAGTGGRDRPRLALLPLENLSGAPAPEGAILSAVEAALRARGIDLVPAAELEDFLGRHRVRWTGGVDRDTARWAREELGADGLLVTSLLLHDGAAPPRLAASMRLVASGEDAAVLWWDGAARTGDDAPGLFGTGVVSDLKGLEPRVFGALAGSLAAWLSGTGPAAPRCPDDRRFRPRIAYRSPELDTGEPRTVAVLPFLDQTHRRKAGDAVAVELARALASAKGLRPVEPGIVRRQLLDARLVLEGGVSIDTARTILGTIGADLVLAGTVRDLADQAGATGAPRVDLTVLLIDRESEKVVWESTSYAHGDDRVFFFDAGRVETASGVACRMARAVVDRMEKK